MVELRGAHPYESSPGAVSALDVVVVGGGIIGLSIAWELAKRGRSVTVLEANKCGQAASWAGVGILPPVAIHQVNDPLEQLRSLSHQLLAEWSTQLEKITGIDVGYRQCGGVYVATLPGEAALLSASHAWWDELGIEAVRWTNDQLREHEPALAQLADSSRLKAIWHLPGECQLRTPRYVQALISACRQCGVTIVEQAHVQAIDERDGHVHIAVAGNNEPDTQCFTAANCCLTAGPWTSQLLDRLDIASGILPIRGQVLLFHPPKRLLTRIINEGNRYLVPRDDGCLLVGSNEEEVGFVCETTPEIVAELRQWAIGMVPVLEEVPIKHAWAGLRPAAYDSYPYIGRLPDHPSIYVASGHYRAGIHLSAGTARVIGELMTEGRASIDLSTFRPGRG